MFYGNCDLICHAHSIFLTKATYVLLSVETVLTLNLSHKVKAPWRDVFVVVRNTVISKGRSITIDPHWVTCLHLHASALNYTTCDSFYFLSTFFIPLPVTQQSNLPESTIVKPLG